MSETKEISDSVDAQKEFQRMSAKLVKKYGLVPTGVTYRYYTSGILMELSDTVLLTKASDETKEWAETVLSENKKGPLH